MFPCSVRNNSFLVVFRHYWDALERSSKFYTAMTLWKFNFASFFIFCILIVIVFSNEPFLQRSPDKRLQFAMFKDHLFHALDDKLIETAYVETVKHCLLKCVKNRQCFSTNFGVTLRDDGKVLCELLSSDKYNSSGSFQQSSSFHHFSILVSCLLFLCVWVFYFSYYFEFFQPFLFYKRNEFSQFWTLKVDINTRF